MPDIVISSTYTFFNSVCYSRYVVGVDQDTHYVFYVDGSRDLAFRKSIDGGATWSGATIIQTGGIVKINVWFDQWTPSDIGTLIHIVLLDAGGNSVSYYTLDTVDDTLSVEVVINSQGFADQIQYSLTEVTIAKSRGGNLLVQYWKNATNRRACYRSVDGGATWVVRADGADGDAVDFVQMYPGNETDDNDFWMLYLDVSVNELSLKTFDDSLNSWSEALIIGGIVENNTIWQIAGAVRHSDNHLLVATCTVMDTATMDILTFDINGAASITPTADVVTDQSESGLACMTINQQNDDVYVGYAKGGTFRSTVDIVYHVSRDNMGSWDAEQAMSEDVEDDHIAISSTLSIGNAGGKFLPVWFNDDLDDIFCNVNNAVSIDPFVPPVPPIADVLPEYGQLRTAVGDPPVYGATILRS